MAQRKDFAKAKHCLISSTVCPRRNGCLHAHMVLGPQCDRLRSLTHKTQRVSGLKPQNPQELDDSNPASCVVKGPSEICFLYGDSHEKLRMSIVSVSPLLFCRELNKGGLVLLMIRCCASGATAVPSFPRRSNRFEISEFDFDPLTQTRITTTNSEVSVQRSFLFHGMRTAKVSIFDCRRL